MNDPRTELLDRASRGEITPEEAEAEAARLGFLPFARTPDPAKLNPMTESWWTLAMAAAWIIWRTPTAVRRVWHEYRREKIEWRGPFCYHAKAYGYRQQIPVDENGRPIDRSLPEKEIVKEYHLDLLRDLTLFDVFAREAYRLVEDGQVVVEGTSAQKELWRALQSGKLVAVGIRPGTSERCPISDLEWVDLDYFEHSNWPSDAIGTNLEKQERYRAVRVRSDDVIRL